MPSLEATGSLYYENDRGKPGFNPNEEHALMQGGQAFALRDDLNVTAPDPATYTSDPFVLLAYTEQDGRPAIRTFRVRREKPEAGITFEYTKPAGAILQAPMPLPLLGPAFAPKIPGQTREGLNQELVSWRVNASVTNAVTDPQPPLEGLSMDWTLTTEGTHGFRPFWPLALQTNLDTSSPVTRWFYATAVTHDTLTGVASTNRPEPMLSLPDGEGQPEVESQWAFGTTNASVPLGPTLLAVPSQRQSWSVIVTNLVNVDDAPSYVVLDFGIPRPGDATTNGVENGVVLVPSITGLMDGAFDRWMHSWNELTHGGGGLRAPAAL